MEIIICKGIPGSGKSTWAKQWVSQSPRNRIRINDDDIRGMFGEYWIRNHDHIPFLKEIRETIIKNGVINNYDIVIDNMNLSPNDINDIKLWVQEACFEKFKKEHKKTIYEISFKHFKTPLEECIVRDSKRPIPVGEAQIRMIYNMYKKFYEE
jgi:tRNA uridine 5-carbamoylmethylation protein Kti12